MRFVLHGSQSLRGIQIDWTAQVDVGPEVRAAMAGEDVDRMQAGIVRAGYLVNTILYPRGTRAFRLAEGHEIFLELPAAADLPTPSARRAVATVATVDRGDAADRHRIVVGDRDDGARVDRIIVGAVPALSRATVQRLIDDGHVNVAGAAIDKANRRLRRGDTIEVEVARVVEPADGPPAGAKGS